VTLDNQTDLGVEWSVTGKNGGRVYSMGTQLGVANALSSLGGGFGEITGTDLNFLLRALTTESKLRVLSRPEIVTADNQPATIDIGQQIPLVNESRLDVQNNLSTSFTYQDVGISLTVTPKISRDGFVQMTLQVTNSDISTTTIAVNKQTSSPVIDMRRANTTVTARNNETVLIGGLISTSDSKNTSKIPYLGDIPYLGAVFRTTSVIRQRQELLILLTPQILANVQEPVALENAAEVTRRQLDQSIFKDQKDYDQTQQRLMRPLFQTNKPPPVEIQKPSPMPTPR
jgi:general secretion pathway protein D